MAAFGFKPSELDGTEYVFSVAANVASVPSRYSYKRFLPKVIGKRTSRQAQRRTTRSHFTNFTTQRTHRKKE